MATGGVEGKEVMNKRKHVKCKHQCVYYNCTVLCLLCSVLLYP